MDLLPGHDWEAEIRAAVRASNAVIVCLSCTSVTKEGYLQKEIRQALEMAAEKPEGTIFLIPARLDDCEVPANLRQWHRVDLFKQGEYERLVGALRARAIGLGIPADAPTPNPAAAVVRTMAKLPEDLRRRIGELAIRPLITQAVERVFCMDEYPTVMTLSTEPVINPIWRKIPKAKRARLSRSFSPFGDLPPRIMHLDIFLIRADDVQGRPRLFNYFSGKPHSGWQAFLLPFRHKRARESEAERHSASATDIASFLGIDSRTVHVNTLGEQFVVSIKPDPGYSELVAYIFEFCSVRFDDPPGWMSKVDCEIQLEQSVRRFRWFHPEEMEQDQRAMLVDGDVIRGVHYFFATTLPAVPASVPSGFLR